MRAKSHQLLGHYLADRYMTEAPRRYIWAFLLGCIEPDKNPTTYLKGSIRCQWLRGHNWGNSQRYMQRVSIRLERRRKLRLLDFYTLGKLIHYTTDAFTFAHNECFPENLHQHCYYERRLQSYFTGYMAGTPEHVDYHDGSIMDAIREYHQDYIQCPSGVHTDSQYSVAVCSLVLAQLLANRSANFRVAN